MHDCSIADTPICNRLIASFSTAAMHFPMLANLLNRIRKIKLKKDLSKYKKICNLKANIEASNVRTFTSEYSKVNFNIHPSPNMYRTLYVFTLGLKRISVLSGYPDNTILSG